MKFWLLVLLWRVCNAENMYAVHFLYTGRRYTIPHPLSQRGLVREGSHDELVGNFKQSDMGFCLMLLTNAKSFQDTNK